MQPETFGHNKKNKQHRGLNINTNITNTNKKDTDQKNPSKCNAIICKVTPYICLAVLILYHKDLNNLISRIYHCSAKDDTKGFIIFFISLEKVKSDHQIKH